MVKAKPGSARTWFAADFETTTDPTDCRVWAWGCARVGGTRDLIVDNNLDSFIDFISMEDSVTFFHNLKFDGAFILYWLFTHGYEYSFARKPAVGTFTSLISDKSSFYTLTVKWMNGKVTEFRDSAKKFPGMSIARIAKSFNLPMTKGDIDYDAPRPKGHVITPDEYDYISRDVLILASALDIVKAEGMLKLTISSDAMNEFKDTRKGDYDRFFPTLSPSFDAEIRKAYRGGFTYSDSRFRMKRCGAGIVLDVNSLYPHVMRNMLLPFGEPEFVFGQVETTDTHPLSVFVVTITATIKPNHIPCIQVKGHSQFNPNEYVTEIKEPTSLVFTNIDWALYLDHYDIKVLEYWGGWRFKGATGLFTEYIDKWGKVKAESTGGKRELAKLRLNSIYGKFGMNPLTGSKTPTFDGERVRLVDGTTEVVDGLYLPMAVFITSYARDLTIRAGQLNYQYFAYADTDSLHLLGDHWEVRDNGSGLELLNPPEGFDVHPTRMGAWKLEYAFTEALFIRPKAYLEKVSGKSPEHREDCEPGCQLRHDFKNAFAGLPDRVSGCLSFDDIHDGASFSGKLLPKTVAGGIVLMDSPYVLKL